MTYADFGWYRLNGGHSAAVKNLPFSHDLNGWPYDRQALTWSCDFHYNNMHINQRPVTNEEWAS